MATSIPGSSKQNDHSRSVFRNTLRGEDAYARHQRYVNQYVNVYGARKRGAIESKTDFDVLKAAHEFIRDENEDLSKLSWDEQLAVKYYSSLFKEFVICDLKHYKSGKIALRWRVDSEVIDGIGQFTCANPRCAYHAPQPEDEQDRMPALQAYELPFAYMEHDEPKHALVKAVLCKRCAKKLTWKRERDKERAAREVRPEVIEDEFVPAGSLPLKQVDEDEVKLGERTDHGRPRRSSRSLSPPPLSSRYDQTRPARIRT